MMDCQQAKCRLLYGISSTLQEASIRVQVQEKARRTECKGLLFPLDFQKQKIGQAKSFHLCLTDFFYCSSFIYSIICFSKIRRSVVITSHTTLLST